MQDTTQQKNQSSAPITKRRKETDIPSSQQKIQSPTTIPAPRPQPQSFITEQGSKEKKQGGGIRNTDPPPNGTGRNNNSHEEVKTSTGEIDTQVGNHKGQQAGSAVTEQYYFTNSDRLEGKQINWVYTSFDSTGVSGRYGSFDNTSKLADFRALGFSITLLIFSIYLFHISTRLYRQYFDKKASENYATGLFYTSVFLINFIWIAIVLGSKKIPFAFLTNEFINFPNQFVLGVALSSSLLFLVGIFRFVIIAFIPNSTDSDKTIKDSRFSFIGFCVGGIAALSNFINIWQAFKKH